MNGSIWKETQNSGLYQISSDSGRGLELSNKGALNKLVGALAVCFLMNIYLHFAYFMFCLFP